MAWFNFGGNSSGAARKGLRDTKRMSQQVSPFYQSLLESGGAASSRLADLLGLNGPEAQQRAQNTFMTSPAYQANLDAGLQAVNQQAGAQGMLQSGAAQRALQKTGSDLYANEFNGYLNRLTGQQGAGAQGASGLMGLTQMVNGARNDMGAARDAANQANFGNMVGLGSTILGAFTGMPTGGTGMQSLMPGMQNGRVSFGQQDPWAGLRG